MFMGVYHFDGDSAQLLEGHKRMVGLLPPGALKIHVCLSTEGGISVYDTCPDRATFDRFSSGHSSRNSSRKLDCPNPGSKRWARSSRTNSIRSERVHKASRRN
ncbi:hypothetical protein GCM10027038_43990 [Arthrobacter bambusae]